jgi:hypothetical protein
MGLIKPEGLALKVKVRLQSQAMLLYAIGIIINVPSQIKSC